MLANNENFNLQRCLLALICAKWQGGKEDWGFNPLWQGPANARDYL